MKKPFACILMFLFLFALTSCTPKLPDSPDTHINSSYTAEYEDMTLEGMMILSPVGQLYLDVSTPDELYGLSFSWDESFTIGFRGLNASTEYGYLPDTAFAQIIKDVCDDLCQSDADFCKSEGELYLIKGAVKGKEYVVYTDIDGVIKRIIVPKSKLKLNLENQ